MATGLDLLNSLSNELIVTVTIGDFVIDEDIGEKIEQSMVLNIHPDIIKNTPDVKFQMVEYIVAEILKNLKEEVETDASTSS